tara:strand:+ start:441 stop:710 length:270 start_codon:yes stop_codon:yes gene_type:complete
MQIKQVFNSSVWIHADENKDQVCIENDCVRSRENRWGGGLRALIWCAIDYHEGPMALEFLDQSVNGDRYRSILNDFLDKNEKVSFLKGY